MTNPRPHAAAPVARLQEIVVRFALGMALLVTGLSCGQQAPPQGSEVRAVRPVVRRHLPVAPAPTDILGTADSQSPAPAATAETAPGLIYRNDWIRDIPWSVNLLKVDRQRKDLELTTTLGHGRTIGLSPLSEQIESIPSQAGVAVAAVNGDYYRTEHESYAGDPRGLQIARGELVSGPNGKTCFWVKPDGQPALDNVVSQFRVTWPDGSSTPFGLNEERHDNEAVLYTSRLGSSTRTSGGRELVLIQNGEGPWLPLRAGQIYKATVRDVRESGNTRLSSETMVLSIGPTFLARVPKVKPGTLLQVILATSPDLSGVEVAIGGGPVLLHGGKVQSTYTNKAHERHPRTAFGWNDGYYFFAQVDGRQYGFSVGMTLPELATYLSKQGCQEAMNLDGGGSAEMWIQGQVVNKPCFGYERNTGNGLVVVRKKEMASAHSP